MRYHLYSQGNVTGPFDYSALLRECGSVVGNAIYISKVDEITFHKVSKEQFPSNEKELEKYIHDDRSGVGLHDLKSILSDNAVRKEESTDTKHSFLNPAFFKLTEEERSYYIEKYEKERQTEEMRQIELLRVPEDTDLPAGRVVAAKVRYAVYLRDGGKCVMCGSKNNIEFDHILPVSKGGSNSENNIQLLCLKCNRKKTNKL